MASNKSKTNNPETNGATAVANTASAAASAQSAQDPSSGRKLRWTSLQAAQGVAQRTKKTNTKKAARTKSDSKTMGDAAAKLSALDAAAKVLQEAGRPMNCQEMIQAMAAKGYWTSPAGKTPSATLYSSILRELKTKAGQARFQKTARGQFVYQNPQAS
jgi:hypothetical protein